MIKTQEIRHILSKRIVRPGCPKNFWDTIGRWLEKYEKKISPVRWFNSWWGLLDGREGIYVVIRLSALVFFLIFAFRCSSWWAIGAIAFIIDILLANTSIVFVTRQPASEFRSVVLTFISYVSLGIGFAVLYSLMANEFCPSLNTLRALYFSFVTMTTLGYGDVQPKTECWQAQILIVIQLIISLYFLAVLIAAVVSWGSSTSRMSPKT